MDRDNNSSYSESNNMCSLPVDNKSFSLPPMNLGSRVKQARELAGMTQDELAQAVGVSQTAIHLLEYRDSKSSRKAVELARALKVSAEWLVSGLGEMKPEPQSAADPRPGHTSMRPIPIITWQRAMKGNVGSVAAEDVIGESYAKASETATLIALMAETDEMDGFRGPTRIQKGSHLIIAPDTAQLPLEELTGKVVAAYKDDGSYCFRQLERQGGQFVLTAWSDRAWLPVIPLSEGWKIIGQVVDAIHFMPLIDL